MRNGIVAVQSSLGANNCTISDMHELVDDYDAPFIDMTGKGIYLVDYSYGDIRKNDIDDVRQGIVVVQSKASVIDNDIDDAHYGIYFKDNAYGEIHSNELSGKRGIYVLNCWSTDINVTENDIIVENNGSVHNAINVQTCQNTYSDPGHFFIEENTIETNGKSQIGIFMDFSSYWKVSENEITQNSFITDYAAGIRLDDNHNLQIRDNTITGNDTDDDYPAIEVFNSKGIIYCCNTLDKSEIGMHFMGECYQSTIATTQFNNHDIGLLYDASAFTGHQGDDDFSNGNYWYEDNDTYEAEHSGGENVAPFSKYYVLSSEGADDIEPDENWFNIISGTGNNCTNWSDCGETEWLTPFISSVDTSIIEDELDSLEFADVVTWLAKQSLYKKLIENPSLYTSNQMMEDFKDSTANSEIGRLYEVELAFLEAVSMLDSLDEIINDYHTRIDSFMNELDSLNTLLVGATSTDSTQIMLQKDTIMDDLQSATEDYNEEIDSFLVYRRSELENVESINDTITVSSDMAENEQEVNELEIDYWLDGFSADTSVVSDLYDIAKLCPLVDGNAVFRARSLHDIITKELINWDSLANCSGASGQRIKSNKKDNKQKLLVYPNPTDGSFTVEILNKKAIPANLSLFDIKGHKVEELTTNNSPIQLDGSHLSQGVYTIKVQLETGEILTNRIVIVH